MKDRIAAYIAQGLAESKVAEILGCSPSYISQVKAEEGFDEEVKEFKKRIKKSEDETKVEESYMRLEIKTMQAIEENLPFAEFSELTRLMGALAQKRASKTLTPANSIVSNITNNTVVLQIPQAVIPEITLNQQKEVVAIGKRSLSPMTAQGVRALFTKVEEQRQLPSQVEKELALGHPISVTPEDF